MVALFVCGLLVTMLSIVMLVGRLNLLLETELRRLAVDTGETVPMLRRDAPTIAVWSLSFCVGISLIVLSYL